MGEQIPTLNCRGIHLTHLNIRSLLHKHAIIEQIKKKKKITIFGISESWLTTDSTDNILNIKGYSIFRNDRKWNERQTLSPKKGGGVCCYVKDGAMVSSHELSNLNISTINAEILWLTLDHARMNKICIANVYRTPQGNVHIFCDILEEQITFIKENFNHEPEIFIMGDCNIDYLRPREVNTKSLKWIEQSMGLKQLIKNTTWYSTIESCIDLIFTNFDKIKCSDIHDLNISDHQMISVTRKHLTKPNNSNSFLGRSYRNSSTKHDKNNC